MNKALIIFILGLAAGGTGGYFLGKYMQEKKSQEQIRHAEEHYRKRYEAKLNGDIKEKMINDLKEEATEKEVKKAERIANVPDMEESEYREVVQRNDYTLYSKQENPTDEDYLVEVKNGPYEVQPGVYDDFLGIDRFDVTYFAEDQVVMDSHETVWNDYADKIGLENLAIDRFGRFEPDIIYIINEDYGQGYKVTLDEGSYNDYMSGI